MKELAQHIGAGVGAGVTGGLFMHNVGRSTPSAIILGVLLGFVVLLVIRLERAQVLLLQPRRSRWGFLPTMLTAVSVLALVTVPAVILQ